MAARRPIPRRTPFFVCVEGDGDRALARWWQDLGDLENLHIHLATHVSGGGDGRSVVEDAVGRLRRHSKSRERYKAALVLFDADRIEQDPRSKRDPTLAEGHELLQIVYLRPNLEGLLLRLCPGCENRFMEPGRTLPLLRQEWLDYVKPMPASALGKRFGLDDLRRAAQRDRDLRRALATIGLLKSA